MTMFPQRVMRVLLAAGLAVMLLGGAAGCSKAKKDAISLMNSGVRAYESNDHNTAYAQFQRAVEIWPEAALAYYHMGLIDLHERQAPDKALAHFTKARELSPGDRDVIFQIARLHEGAGRVTEALEAVEATLKLDPHFAPAHHVKGSVLKMHGDFDGADAAFREAIACDPKYGRAFEDLARMYEELEHETEARAVYEEALKHADRTPDLLNNLGILKLQAGDHAGAIELFKETIIRDGTRTDALFNVAYAHVQAGEHKKAIASLESYEKNADPTVPGVKETLQTARAMKKALHTEMVAKEAAAEEN